MDKIIVKDLKLFCYHGVNPEEKIDGQNFVFDSSSCPQFGHIFLFIMLFIPFPI